MKILAHYLFEYAGQKFLVEDLVEALKRVDIGSGDKLFVHSDLRSFGKINPQIGKEEYLDAFVGALTGLVGESGTIIMPTFSYSFCRGEVYDPQRTLSTVGILTEHFRKMTGVVRTIDPIFSVAVWGVDQKFYQMVGGDCFGNKSIFQKIYDADFKILFLGETFDLTYLHFIEQAYGVSYRYRKKFTGQIIIDGELKEFAFDYNVRPLDGSIDYNLEAVADFLNRRGVLKTGRLGYSRLRLVGAKDAYAEITAGLKANPKLLLI